MSNLILLSGISFAYMSFAMALFPNFSEVTIEFLKQKHHMKMSTSKIPNIVLP